MQNLYSCLPKSLSQELTEVLLESSSIRIERIVSTAHRSPDDFWYDQDECEWVAVLKGEAKIRFKENLRQVKLRPGDYLNIPAHCKHRVDSTSEKEPTVWLAIFYQS